MKTLLFVLILGLSLTYGEQEKYFPDAYRNVYIGMPMDSLVTLKGHVLDTSQYINGKRQLTETPVPDTVVKRILYLFDKDNRIYEVIIEYKDHFDLTLYMTDRYGPANIENDEWLFALPSGRELHIWQYQNKLCIADGAIYK